MLSKLCVKESFNKKQSCEDSVYVYEGEVNIVGCVADGCSQSINSSFASRLLCYIYEKHMYYPQLTNFFMENIIRELRQVAELLELSRMHLLSTFIPFVYSKETRILRVRVFGDGFIHVNGQEFKYEQNNEPDYIGYQVEESFATNTTYLDKYPEIVFEDVDSFIISSDGIDSFAANQYEESSNPNDIFKLLEPPTGANYLQRTYNILRNRKFTNSDDVGIISYVKD
jgi:hypothetical protein